MSTRRVNAVCTSLAKQSYTCPWRNKERLNDQARYLLFYDECELEWIALAGAGPAERIEFHKNLPELQMITELNARVHYLKKVLGPAPRVRCVNVE